MLLVYFDWLFLGHFSKWPSSRSHTVKLVTLWSSRYCLAQETYGKLSKINTITTSSSMTMGELLSPEGTGLGVKSANSANRASRLAPDGETLSHRFV